MPPKLTKTDFIERARKVHGNRYDYSRVVYKTTHENVKIICKEHGEFFQQPANHLSGSGCLQCGFQSTGKNISSSTAEFIAKAREIHGNRYDYSKVEYVKSNRKVKITCKIHGDFLKTPNHHLQGQGCSECAISSRSAAQSVGTRKFIELAQEVHGNVYDYSLVNYRKNRTNVTLICRRHGEFSIAPSSHLKGYGCRLCSSEFHISNAEHIFSLVLDSLKLRYKSEARFDKCRNKKPLPFDFQVFSAINPKHYILVEIDGKQHEEPVDFFGGIRAFLSRKSIDAIKNQFCISNGITLLRFSATDIVRADIIQLRNFVISELKQCHVIA